MVEVIVQKFGVLLLEKSTRKVENYHDPFAVTVVRSGVIIGHVPSLEVLQLDALK